MQEENQLSVKKRLQWIARYKNLKEIQGVADYIGVTRGRLYSWIKRESIVEPELILGKMPEIRRQWLLTGDGEPLLTPPQRITTATASNHSNAVAADGCFNVSISQGNQGIESSAVMQLSERERRLIERMRRYASVALWEKFEAEIDEQERKFI
jgi:hypothetical protein